MYIKINLKETPCAWVWISSLIPCPTHIIYVVRDVKPINNEIKDLLADYNVSNMDVAAKL